MDRGSGLGCEICQLAFSRQGPLLDHYRRKHQINLTHKLNDRVCISTKLKDKKLTTKISQPCVREVPNVVNGTETVLNNVEVTKFDALPKSELLIVRHVGNMQENTSNIIIESINQTKLQNIQQYCRDHKQQSNEAGMLTSSTSKNCIGLSGSGIVQTRIYSGNKILEKHNAIEGAAACDKVIKNTQSNNQGVDADAIITAHKLPWCEEQTNEDTNVEFNANALNTNATSMDYITKSEQNQHIVLKKLVSPSESDNNFIGQTNLGSATAFVRDSLSNAPVSLGHCDVDNTNSDSIEENGIFVSSNSETIEKTNSLRTVKRRGKLTPVSGKIPQELYMSDFYFLKITSQTGSTPARCSGRDLFQCIFCKEIMKWRSDICRHMRQFHMDILDSGEALKFPAVLDSEEATVMKMTDYIKLEMVKKPGKRVRGVETQDLPGEFACEECGKVFHRLRNLRFHRRVHEKGNEFMCSICSKLLKTKVSFERHLKTHQKREAYKCNQCDFESTVNIAIHKHRQIHSTNSHLCDICGLAYKDKSTLTKHKKVHDLSRPFACTHPGCSWRFLTEVMCNAHIRSHTSKRKFECQMCGYVFKQKHHLQRHEKIVHNITHKTKSGFHSYNWDMEATSESELHSDGKDANSLEVSHEVSLIINEGTIPGVMSSEHFDLESALQSGQLVIANDEGTNINYEMSDIGSNVVYQTLLHDGVGQQFETHTVCIAPSDTGEVSFHEVDSVQTEVEIEQS